MKAMALEIRGIYGVNGHLKSISSPNTKNLEEDAESKEHVRQSNGRWWSVHHSLNSNFNTTIMHLHGLQTVGIGH
jgi:hypothetical protein